MQFYRRLSQIKAISFDLDDTLYNNRPVMQAIEKKMLSYFADKFAVLLPELPPPFHFKFWQPFRAQAITADNDISHDVVQLRFETYRLGFIAHKIPVAVAEPLAQEALAYFIHLRSDFTVPQASYDLLARLGKAYPLVAISNGNVDTKVLGIDHYFRYIYHAGFQLERPHGVVGGIPAVSLLKQKPAVDMFTEVCQQLAILPQELLHVGDCGFSDIHGALNAGCQTAWLPRYGVGKALRQIPHIELNKVSDLLGLITP
ncbi:MAG: HAD family hydrolase [Colwellia sp.]